MAEILDTKKIIRKIHNFYDEFKKKEIKKLLSTDTVTFHLSFYEIAEYDPELADWILKNPTDGFLLLEETLKQFYDINTIESLKVRFVDLPNTEKLKISEIRQKHIGDLVLLQGLIKRKSEIQPRVKFSEYLCTNHDCSLAENKIKVPQIEEKAMLLKACPKCKAPIEKINDIMVDSQNILLEEDFDLLKPGQQPKSINVLLRDDDLVLPNLDSKIAPGRKVFVIGVVNAVKGSTKTGAESVNRTLVIDCNYIGLAEDDEDEIELTEEEINEFEKIAKRDDVYDYLVSNTIPEIEGMKNVKEGGLLMTIGANKVESSRGFTSRGDIHILLIGDPSVAKSQFISSIIKLSSRHAKVTGKGASGVGITAAVVKDEFTGSYALEAGPMVLASGGVLGLDEMDKIAEDDTSYLLEGMEQQTITIAKANIRATLHCETSIIAGANPKHGRFDPTGDISKQINFPAPLISRFDLIFVLKDIPDKKRDNMIGEKILSLYRGDIEIKNSLSVDFLKRYLIYAKRFRPTISKNMTDKLLEYYIKTRSANYDESGIKSIGITPRQLGGLVRLATAYAKLALSKEVTELHIKKAMDMFKYSLEGIGYDSETGTIDIDRIMTGVSASSRNKLKIIRDIIDKLEQEKPEILLDDIVDLGKEEGVDKPGTLKAIESLKTEGVIFEPRKHTYKKLY